MKKDILSIQEEVFKVIGNKKRLEIILLLEHREMNVTEMTQMLGLKQANLSQHLTLLRNHNLVIVTKNGRESNYKLADPDIAKNIRSLHGFLSITYKIDSALETDSLFPIVIDPVCGMRFSASKAYSHIRKDDKSYYFCASGCEDTFVSS